MNRLIRRYIRSETERISWIRITMSCNITVGKFPTPHRITHYCLICPMPLSWHHTINFWWFSITSMTGQYEELTRSTVEVRILKTSRSTAQDLKGERMKARWTTSISNRIYFRWPLFRICEEYSPKVHVTFCAHRISSNLSSFRFKILYKINFEVQVDYTTPGFTVPDH